MRVLITVGGGGRMSTGAYFIYKCADCDAWLESAGEEDEDFLEHPSTIGILRWKKSLDCPSAGKKCERPKLILTSPDL